jgi:hypothetical protein
MAGLDPATHAVRHSDRKLEGSDTVSTLAIAAAVGDSQSKTT